MPRRVLSMIVVSLAVGGSASAQWSTTPAPSGWETTTQKQTGDANAFSVVYLAPKLEQLKVWEGFAHGLNFEALATYLNQTFKMPRPLPIVYLQCGTVNAFYTEDKHAILVCYELMAYFRDVFAPRVKSEAELTKKVAGAIAFTFLHELGHALAGELALPITGKEEDAADQLAALILSRSKEMGRDSALAAAEWFAIEGQRKQQKGAIVWYDEHSFDLQRMYDIICTLYGQDQQSNAGLARSVSMSEDRAARCARETPRRMQAWRDLLKPHLRQ
jgi:hypothetical protein